MDPAKDPPPPTAAAAAAAAAAALKALQQAFTESGQDLDALKDLASTLERVMRDCSLANIEMGKTWIFGNCRREPQITAVMGYILALSQSRSAFAERLHLVYLINDVLYHSERKVREWIKDAMIPHVVPLLQLTYQAAATTEEQKKVDKVINIWDDKRFFNKPIMHWIRQSTSSIASTESAAAAAAPLTSFPAPWQQQQQSPITSNSSNFASTSNNIRNEYAAVPTQPSRRSIPAGPSIRPRPPSPATPSTPPKQYFELPVGCMIPAIEASGTPYAPIKVSQVRPTARLTAARIEALTPAIDDFYAKLDLRDTSNFLEEPQDPQLDHSGWEKGYLDTFYENLKMRQSNTSSSLSSSSSSSERSRRWTSRSPSSRSPSPPSRSSYHHHHYRHRSSHHRDYDRRGRSPERSYHHHCYKSSSRRRQRSYSSSSSRSRSRSRSRSPPQRFRSPLPPHHRSSSTRKVCSNCSKTGHVARDCPESPPR